MTTIPDRRELTIATVDAIVAEAERLAAGEVRVSGGHSFAQILNHLAISQDAAAGRLTAPPPPLLIRLMRPLIRKMVLNDKPLKAGIKLPEKSESFFWPNQDSDVPTSLAYLKDSVEYYKTNGPVPVHPLFGKLTREQADQLQCRHAALHLSFVHSV